MVLSFARRKTIIDLNNLDETIVIVTGNQNTQIRLLIQILQKLDTSESRQGILIHLIRTFYQFKLKKS